jgi:hypothetical protein
MKGRQKQTKSTLKEVPISYPLSFALLSIGNPFIFPSSSTRDPSLQHKRAGFIIKRGGFYDFLSQRGGSVKLNAFIRRPDNGLNRDGSLNV